MIGVAFGNGYKGAQSASEVTLALGSASVALGQGLEPVALGQDSTHFCFSRRYLGNSLSVLDTNTLCFAIIFSLALLAPFSQECFLRNIGFQF